MNGIILTTKEELSTMIESVFKQVLTDQNLVSQIESEPVKEILNIEEVCELINLAKPTVYTLTSKGKIPYFKRGKKLYFRRSELLEWIEEGRQSTFQEDKAALNHYLYQKEKGGKR